MLGNGQEMKQVDLEIINDVAFIEGKLSQTIEELRLEYMWISS
jgi:hypothetical protein